MVSLPILLHYCKAKHIITVALIALCAFTAACGFTAPILPPISNTTIWDAITTHRQIISIQAVLELEHIIGDTTTYADASLQLSKDNMHIKFYRTGFLVGEIIQNNNSVVTKPTLDNAKKEIIVEGIRNSFFWWDTNCDNFKIDADSYFMLCDNKIVFFDKQTLLPVKQTIQLPSGDTVEILYSKPKHVLLHDLHFWYQSTLSIKFKDHLLTITIKDYEMHISR